MVASVTLFSSEGVAQKVAHQHSMVVINKDASKEIKQHIVKYKDQFENVALFIKARIDELETENLSNKHQPGCGEGTAIERIRSSTTYCLKKEFKRKLYESQALRERMHQDIHEATKRKVYTVTGMWADEEKIDQIIERGESENIFRKAVQEETLEYDQDRKNHSAVRELEEQMMLSLDMTIFDEPYDENLNNIEAQVARGVEYSPTGRGVELSP